MSDSSCLSTADLNAHLYTPSDRGALSEFRCATEECKKYRQVAHQILTDPSTLDELDEGSQLEGLLLFHGLELVAAAVFEGDNDGWFVRSIGVNVGSQGSQMGFTLMQTLIQHLRNQCDEECAVRWRCHRKNDASRSLSERVGASGQRLRGMESNYFVYALQVSK